MTLKERIEEILKDYKYSMDDDLSALNQAISQIKQLIREEIVPKEMEVSDFVDGNDTLQQEIGFNQCRKEMLDKL